MKKIVIITIVFSIIIYFVGIMAEYENKQPCNYFANTPTKNVPLRCANANVTENPNEKTNN